MLSCNCSAGVSSRWVGHKWDCSYLQNNLKDSCCDYQLCGLRVHNVNCINFLPEVNKPKPMAMWARLLVYEGQTEWVDMCIQKTKTTGMKEGYTQIGPQNSITSTTVCYRNTTLGSKNGST